MDESKPVRAVHEWSARPDPRTFPYGQLVAEYHRVGKHFVDKQLLDLLDSARAALLRDVPDGPAAESAGTRRVRCFLDVLLDKHDDRYDYPTYLALSLLPLPDTATAPDQVAPGSGDAAQLRHDRLLVQLGADLLDFELAAADGRTTRFPHLRPDPRTVVKRYRLGLRSLDAALARLGLADDGPREDLAAAAGRVCATVAADASPDERAAVQLSILPVWVSHDEYLFIRVLQSFETVFALLAARLLAALAAVRAGRPEPAAREVAGAGNALEESAGLFSLLATMQVESFQQFREYTDGASAIQSRNYKLVESLCRMPDAARLDSVAYRSTPEIRQRVLDGSPNLDDELAAAAGSGALTPAECADLAGVMHRFADQLLKWRRTHYRLAVRMLGERPGTGYTEGTPYLRDVRTIPVFEKTGPPGHAVEPTQTADS